MCSEVPPPTSEVPLPTFEVPPRASEVGVQAYFLRMIFRKLPYKGIKRQFVILILRGLVKIFLNGIK